MIASLAEVSARDLRKAAALKERIEELQSELNSLLGAGGGTSARAASEGAPRRGRRRMSAEAKARLAAIAKARWKKAKASGRMRL
jgi:hypothetical protein